MTTLFHQIRDGEAPAHIVYDTADVLAFLDINPATKGHTLIIPKDHSEGLQDTPTETWMELIKASKTLADHYEDVLGCDGFNVIQSTGEAAEQEIPYIHIHLIPRYNDDAFKLWTNRPAESDLDDLADQLRYDP